MWKEVAQFHSFWPIERVWNEEKGAIFHTHVIFSVFADFFAHERLHFERRSFRLNFMPVSSGKRFVRQNMGINMTYKFGMRLPNFWTSKLRNLVLGIDSIEVQPLRSPLLELLQRTQRKALVGSRRPPPWTILATVLLRRKKIATLVSGGNGKPTTFSSVTQQVQVSWKKWEICSHSKNIRETLEIGE